MSVTYVEYEFLKSDKKRKEIGENCGILGFRSCGGFLPAPASPFEHAAAFLLYRTWL